jgi:hypothetical protein
MLAEVGVPWEETPDWFKFGTIVKKKRILKPAVNLKTGQPVVAERVEMSSASAGLLQGKFSEENIKLLISKLLTEEELPQFYSKFT